MPFAAAILLFLLFDLEGRSDLPPPGWKLFVEIVVFAPFFETIFLQTVPVAFARLLGWGFRGQLIAAWLPFAVLHFTVSVGTGVCAGVISGFYIGFTYAHWRQVSLRSAFWMTTATHALHNFISMVVALVAVALDK